MMLNVEADANRVKHGSFTRQTPPSHDYRSMSSGSRGSKDHGEADAPESLTSRDRCSSRGFRSFDVRSPGGGYSERRSEAIRSETSGASPKYRLTRSAMSP